MWGSKEPTTRLLEKVDWKVDWDWLSKFGTLEIPQEMQTWTSSDTDQVVQYYGGLRSGRNPGNKGWMRLQLYGSDRLWQSVMLWCLRYQKKQGLMLLLATLRGRKYKPPRHVVSDSLTFLARHFLFKVSDPSPMAVDAIWHLTCKFIDGAADQEENFDVNPHLVYAVLRHVDDSRVLSFYRLLGRNKVFLHADTMLHFLNRFIDMGRISISMEVLGSIAGSNFNLVCDQVQAACVKLLRARFGTQEEDYTLRSNILKQILEMGVRPQRLMYNIILLNAGQGGDFANAWQMYRLAKENKENDFVPNSDTYRVLLRGAVLSCNISHLRLVMREVETDREVLQDVRLLGDVLNAISLMSPGNEFGAMLDFYKQHCDLRPLQELSLCGEETQAPPGANRYGVQPDEFILTRMIVAYVKQHQDSHDLIHQYYLYCQRVKENHPLIAPIAQRDEVPNTFITAFGKQAYTVPYCVKVIKRMLELSSQSHPTSDIFACSPPTVRTWSCLVAAYFRHGQKRSAMKVIDMMRERGIENDQVTWNIIVSGYSSLQDTDAAVDTVKRMEAAGFEPDAYTNKGLQRLWVPERLVQASEANMEKPPADKENPEGHLLPLDSEEQHEANTAVDRMLRRADKVRKYLVVKGQEQLGMELEDPSDGLLVTA